MFCRGGYASAPLAGGASFTSRFATALGLAFLILTSGKSSIGPDQVSSVFSKGLLRFCAAGNSGHGTTKMAICHSAAAKMALRGIFPSIRQPRKILTLGAFFGRRVH